MNDDSGTGRAHRDKVRGYGTDTTPRRNPGDTQTQSGRKYPDRKP